jgi:hypothetical protein
MLNVNRLVDGFNELNLARPPVPSLVGTSGGEALLLGLGSGAGRSRRTGTSSSIEHGIEVVLGIGGDIGGRWKVVFVGEGENQDRLGCCSCLDGIAWGCDGRESFGASVGGGGSTSYGCAGASAIFPSSDTLFTFSGCSSFNFAIFSLPFARPREPNHDERPGDDDEVVCNDSDLRGSVEGNGTAEGSTEGSGGARGLGGGSGGGGSSSCF